MASWYEVMLGQRYKHRELIRDAARGRLGKVARTSKLTGNEVWEKDLTKVGHGQGLRARLSSGFRPSEQTG
jgi:hypothetical protein